MTDKIDWSDDEGLGEQWWTESAATVGATNQQKIFAASFHRGMTQTGAARLAGYAGGEDSIRQAGHRAAHSTAVVALLGLAHAATGTGPSGNVDMDESKQILSRLARQSDPNTRLRAIESLVRIHEREVEARKSEPATDIRAELTELSRLSPELAELYAKYQGIPWPETTNG